MRRALLAVIALASAACGPSSREPPTPVDQDPGLTRPDAGGEQVLYPRGPYGNSAGAVIENITLTGYRDLSATQGVEISLSDFYDPEGKKGPDGKPLKLLVINAAALWCSACQLEAPRLLEKCKALAGEGLQCYTAITEAGIGEQASWETLETWRNWFQVDYPIVLDQYLKYGDYFDVAASPMNMFVDLETMTILEVSTGFNEAAFDKSVAKYLGLPAPR